MGSARLPGKSLEPLWHRMPVLEMVIRRVQRASTIDDVVLATSNNPIDDPLLNVAGRCGVSVFRGSETDVLGRLRQALDRHDAETVIRVCADSPLVDPIELDGLVEFFRASGCEYASTCLPDCALPSGVGAEVLSASLLRTLDDTAVAPAHREHVTLMVSEQAGRFAIARVPARPHAAGDVRLDVDYPEDLDFVRAVCAALPADRGPYWRVEEIVREARRLESDFAPREQREVM